MNFLNFKSNVLNILILGITLSFTVNSQANSCLKQYETHDPYAWHREAQTYYDAISLIEGKRVAPSYVAKIRKKHRLSQGQIESKRMTQNIMEAFYRERYFDTVLPQLRMAVLTYSALKFSKNTEPLTEEQYFSEISNLIHEAVLPVLVNEKGELTSDMKLHLQTVLSLPMLYPYKEKEYSLYDRIMEGYKAQLVNHLYFQQKRINLFFPSAPHRAEIKYASTMDGILNMLSDLGVKTKEIQKVPNAQAQLTLVFQAGDKGFDQTNIFKPIIVLKVQDTVAVVLEQYAAGWVYRVVKTEELNEIINPNVKGKKFFKLSFAK